MTTEEAKKAGFRKDKDGKLIVWNRGSNEQVRIPEAHQNLLVVGQHFPTRAKARKALRKRKENEEVNRKSRFIDNFVQPMQEHLSSKSKSEAEHARWLADMRSQTTPITPEQAKMLRIGDSVSAVMTESGATRPYDNAKVKTCVLKTQEQLYMARTGMTVYFTPAAAQAALDKTKSNQDDLIQPRDEVFVHNGHKWEYQGLVKSLYPEEIGKPRKTSVINQGGNTYVAENRKDKLARYQEQHSYMDDAQYAACVEARDWSGADLRAKELDKVKASILPEGVPPVPEGYEFVAPKKEPRKLGPLSKDGWLVCQKGGLWRFDTGDYCGHAIQDLGSNDCLLFGPTYFARPKAKAEAEPLEWCERKVGELIEATDSIWDWLSECWQEPHGRHVGEKLECDDMGCVNFRARYRNPLWLAKHGKDVESHETPVGETQAKEVVTGETQRSTSRPLSDAEFKKLVGRMSLPQLYDALKANGVELEGVGLELKKVDEQSVLKEAEKCVTGPRRRDYGTPDENFGLIASLWSVQLKHEVTPMQVALCLILLKVARQANSPKRDNLVDIAGYAQCASELKGAK